jgi:hypothetical protein
VVLVVVRHLSVEVVFQTQVEVQAHQDKEMMEVLETQLVVNMVLVVVEVLVQLVAMEVHLLQVLVVMVLQIQ